MFTHSIIKMKSRFVFIREEVEFNYNTKRNLDFRNNQHYYTTSFQKYRKFFGWYEIYSHFLNRSKFLVDDWQYLQNNTF